MPIATWGHSKWLYFKLSPLLADQQSHRLAACQLTLAVCLFLCNFSVSGRTSSAGDSAAVLQRAQPLRQVLQQQLLQPAQPLRQVLQQQLLQPAQPLRQAIQQQLLAQPLAGEAAASSAGQPLQQRFAAVASAASASRSARFLPRS